MASSTAESILRQTLEAAQSAVNAQAAAVRQLKSSSSAADTAVVNAVVESLKVLKLEIDATDEQLRDLIKSCGGESKEEFRQGVIYTLEMRLFYIPSFKIIAALLDCTIMVLLVVLLNRMLLRFGVRYDFELI
ncbi:hypothetical protein RND81_04G085300 [Saponaria officinalis]|uniref:Uncharacterized protein n=1 Tax=Saponaria officinalis TaxID=3572 RepID=A0AAW1LJA6_SAPOF